MNLLKYQIPLVLWAIVVYFLSVVPIVHDVFRSFSGGDKLVHALMYAILCWLAWRAFTRQDFSPMLRQRAFLGAFIFCVVSALMDEYNQSFIPGRTPEPMNVVADTGGALLFIAIAMLRNRPDANDEEHKQG